VEEAVQDSYYPMLKTLFCSAGTVTVPPAICKFAIPFANRADCPPSPVGLPRFTVLKSVVRGQWSPRWTGRIPRCSFPHSPIPSVGGTGDSSVCRADPKGNGANESLKRRRFSFRPGPPLHALDIFKYSQVFSHARAGSDLLTSMCCRTMLGFGIWKLEVGNWKPFATGLSFEANDETGQRTNTITSDHSLTKREIRGHRGSRYCRAGSKTRHDWMPILTAPQVASYLPTLPRLAARHHLTHHPLNMATLARRGDPPLYPRHPPMYLFMLHLCLTAGLCLSCTKQVGTALVGMPRVIANRRPRETTGFFSGGVTIMANDAEIPDAPMGKTGT
jgi:hypothetical protein